MTRLISALISAALVGPFGLFAAGATAAKPASAPTSTPTFTSAPATAATGTGDLKVPPLNPAMQEAIKSPATAPKPSSTTSAPALPTVASGKTPDATSGRAAVPPGAPTVSVLREGTFVVNRTGRLTKSADGQQSELTFESDGKALRDPPMIVLPNLKLMQMETAVTGANRDLKFRVSGMVTEYKGRNYVLLEKVVVVQDVDSQF